MPSVEIKSVENGPNLVVVDGKVFTAICRCGQSSKKPLCDGTHGRVGFRAAGAHLVIVEKEPAPST